MRRCSVQQNARCYFKNRAENKEKDITASGYNAAFIYLIDV